MKFSFYLVIFISILAVNILAYEAENFNNFMFKQNKKPRRKLVEVLGDKFVDYFDLKNKIKADRYFRNNQEEKGESEGLEENCNSLDKINRYFFKVYTNNSILNGDSLDEMIQYQVSRGKKDDSIEERTVKNRCKRKKVTGSYFILFLKLNSFNFIIS